MAGYRLYILEWNWTSLQDIYVFILEVFERTLPHTNTDINVNPLVGLLFC